MYVYICMYVYMYVYMYICMYVITYPGCTRRRCCTDSSGNSLRTLLRPAQLRVLPARALVPVPG